MACSEQHVCASSTGTRDSKTDRIRRLNDRFRRTFVGGRVLVTSGVQGLGQAGLAQVVATVQAYAAFNHGNDLYNEHDFGSFTCLKRRFCWKIDYYDRDLELGSTNPADPAVTTRVLTIMLASEY